MPEGTVVHEEFLHVPCRMLALAAQSAAIAAGSAAVVALQGVVIVGEVLYPSPL